MDKRKLSELKQATRDNLGHLFDGKELRVSDFGLLKHLNHEKAIGSDLDQKAKEAVGNALYEALAEMIWKLSQREGFEDVEEKMLLPFSETGKQFQERLENSTEYKEFSEKVSLAIAQARADSRRRAGLK